MTEVMNNIKRALTEAGTLPWQYIELGRNIEHDAIRNANGQTVFGISSYQQENVELLLLAVNNISSLITTIESQKEEIERTRTEGEACADWIITIIQNYSHILSHGITQSGIRLVKGYSDEAEQTLSHMALENHESAQTGIGRAVKSF